MEPLEVVSSFPIPEVHGPVVSPAHQNPVAVHGKTVDDGIVAGQVLNELSLWTLPLFNIVRTTTGEHE